MIQFLYPEMLLLAVPMLFLLRRYFWQPGPTGWLRTLFMLSLLFALAFPQWFAAGRGMDIIVVVDRSRSMPVTEQTVKDLINDLEDNRGLGDRISIVTFGTSAEVERELSETAITNEMIKAIDPNGSDLNEAILTAMDRRNNPQRPARIIVLTDGLYNGPSPLYAARRAREQGIPIDFRQFDRPVLGDVAIDSIQLPREVAPEEPFQFSVLVYADMDRQASVEVRRNGQPIARKQADLRLGMNRLIFRDWVQKPGTHEYSAQAIFDEQDGGDDPVPQNNKGVSAMRVKAPPRVLLVTHDGQPGNVGLALQAGQIPFDAIKPSDSQMTQDALDAYRAVILENVSADSLGRIRMERLRQFVEDLGGGLMMTGGTQSFGNGGYYRSPIEELLPVALDSIEETRRSRAAIVIVLDRSGSMSAPVGGRTKMDLANLGTAECIRLMTPEDKVAVIAVDSSPHLILKMTNVSDPSAICSRVKKIQSMGGGIYVYDGLVAAGRELLSAKGYATRHVILFSDAADSEQPGNYKELLSNFAKAGITVSVIGLGSGSDADADLLKDIAKRGNGNIEFTNDPLDLPRLFTKDTMSMTRNMFLTKESESKPEGFTGRFLPDMNLVGRIKSDQTPTVDGYNLTFLKPDANHGLVSNDENNAPLSAFWYRGLGRVATIAMELDGPYSGNLNSWNDYDAFVATHARWLLGEEEPDDVFVSVRQEGLDAVVEVELDPNRANAKRGIAPKLAVIPPSYDRSEVIAPEFTWTGPDTLEGRFRLDQQGTWRTLVKTGDQEFTQGPILTLPYSPEYMPRDGLPSGKVTLQTISELSGGVGRVNLLEAFNDIPFRARQLRSLVPWLCFLGILFLVTEIAGRRWNWWDRLAAAFQQRSANRQASKESVSEKVSSDRKSNKSKRAKPVATKNQKSGSKSTKQSTQPVQKKSETPVDSPAAGDIFSKAKHRAKNRTK